jgi:hypothetical protein
MKSFQAILEDWLLEHAHGHQAAILNRAIEAVGAATAGGASEVDVEVICACGGRFQIPAEMLGAAFAFLSEIGLGDAENADPVVDPAAAPPVSDLPPVPPAVPDAAAEAAPAPLERPDGWRGWVVRYVPQGAVPPRGWGFAYWRGAAATMAVMPIPLNWAVALWNRVYFTLRIGLQPGVLETERVAAHRQGREEARDELLRELGDQITAMFHVKLALDGGAPSLEEVAAAHVEHVELEQWDADTMMLFAATQKLAADREIVIPLACQDPRCRQNPVLHRVDDVERGGFWLICPHKRRWVSNRLVQRLSIKSLRRMGL